MTAKRVRGTVRQAGSSIVLADGATGQTTLASASTASRTLTLPDATDTLVGLAATQTLTNKTLTSPVISTISNTGTLTLPTSTDTLVGRGTTDTLTNKTLTSPVLTTPTLGVATATSINKVAITAPATSATLTIADGKTFTVNQTLTVTGTSGTTTTFPGTSQTLIGQTDSVTVSNKTFGNTNSFTTRDTFLTLQNNTDTTKQAQFDLSPLTTGAGRTYSLPDADTRLAGLAVAQTWTAAQTFGAATGTTLGVTGTAGAGYLELQEQSATPSSPASGKLRIYPKTSDEALYYLNSSGTESQIGSGSGEKNYLQSGSNTASGWTASSSAITVATDTTAADLPRPQTTKTGIKFTGVSGGVAYGYFRFTLDPADYNKKLKLQFDQSPLSGYVASDFRVDVYSNTAADYTGTNTRLSLSTDSSSVSALPNLTGTYRTTFDAPGSSAKYIEVRVGLYGSNTNSIVLSDVVVGPGTVTQGAALSPPVTWTPTGSWSANSTYAGMYWRHGNLMSGKLRIDLTGAPTAANLTVALPSGLTIDYSNQGTAYTHRVGDVFVVDASTSDRYSGWAAISSSSANNLIIYYLGQSANTDTTINRNFSVSATTPMTFATGDWISIEFRDVPIAEWAGSGTVNVVQNDTIYYYPTGGTWGTSGTLTTAIGPGGVLGGTTTPSSTGFVYTFTPTYPIPAGSKPVLEVSNDQLHWSPLGSPWGGSGVIENLKVDSADTNYVGAGVFHNSNGTLGVRFGKYAYGNTGAWTGAGTWYWRVAVPTSSGAAVGFSEVQPGVSAGLVSANGLKGVSTNSSAPTGYVGELQEVASGTNTNFTTTAQYGGDHSITLTAGDWDVCALVTAHLNSATMTGWDFFIGTATGNSPTGRLDGYNYVQTNQVPDGVRDHTAVLPHWRVSIASTTTYYLKTRATYSAGTPQYVYRMSARRVR